MAESGSSENSSDPDRRIIAGRWEVLKQKLGEGNYGKVYLGRDLKNGVSIAIKVTNMQNLSKDLQERLKGETDILTQINHPNIVTLYDQLQNGRYQLLMLEYMQGRDMHRILVKGKPLSTDLVLKLFGDLTSGLSELHHRNIMHRDLKPQNLLLSSPEPENAVLKIADFGFATFLNPCGLAKTVAGSPLYMAPEVLEAAVGKLNKGYNAKADLYSAGVILYQMVKGEPPHTAMTQVELLRKMRLNTRRPLLNVEDPDLRELVDRLLQPDPNRRMGPEEFISNPWVIKCLVSRPCRAAQHAVMAAAIAILESSCKIKDVGATKGPALWQVIHEKVQGAALVTSVVSQLHPTISAAISLYVKALQLVAAAYRALHSDKELILSVIQNEEWTHVKKEIDSMFRFYSATLTEYLDTAGEEAADEDIDSADNVLFSHARELCLRASVEEMMHNYGVASSMYRYAHDVMKLIASDSTSSVPTASRKTASKCVEMVSKRLKKTAPETKLAGVPR